MSKDENPGLWDSSSAGHVDSGESYNASAHRELREELKIKAVLNPLTKIAGCKETYYEHLQVYFCKTDANIKINQDEISEGKFFDFAVLKTEIQKNPDQYTSTLKLVLNSYAGKIIRDAQLTL